MINYQTITIDLQPDYREPVVQMYLSERDVGRPIQVNVLMQGQPYSFTAGTTVHIDLRKPSGHVVQVNGNYAVGSNVVLFNVVEQMAAEPGMCLTELSIVGDGQDPIGSKNWLTKVELSPLHAGDPSETWIEDLDELVQDAMEGHIDATLSIEGDAADAKAAGDAIAAAVEQIPAVDDTLTVSGDAADAAAVGEELTNLLSVIDEIVRFDVAQEKTDAEKAQARANIGIENVEIYAENVVAEYEIVTEPPKTYSQITQTISAASTVSDKAWNCETGAAETQADSVYARFNGLSQYKKIYVDGRGLTPQTTYPLITFYDTNGTKIGISQGNGSWGSVNMLMDVPAGTSYAIVNGSTASSRPIPPAIRGLINGEKIGTMIPLTGTVTEGAKVTDGSIRSGENYYHIRYNTIPDSTYIYVSGMSWGATYPLIFFYNASDQLISSDYAYSASIFNSVELSIPSNTSYFIVNMTHIGIVGEVDQGVRYPTSETGRVPTKTQAEYNDELRPLIDKKYLFVGDSYAQGYTHDGMNSGWCRYAADYLGLESSKYEVVYTGGYGFANGGFSNLLNTVTGSDFTDVVVCGGYNDRSSTVQDIINGITSFKNRALEKWEDAKIHVGFIAYNKAGSGDGAVQNWQEIRANLVGVVLPAYQKCITVGCEYLNNVEYSLGESGLSPSDGYHPGAEGNQAIARAVSNALLTGSAALPYNADLRSN